MAIFQIKRSLTTPIPANNSLEEGELAYSFASGKLFIGNSQKNPVDIISQTLNNITLDGGTF